MVLLQALMIWLVCAMLSAVCAQQITAWGLEHMDNDDEDLSFADNPYIHYAYLTLGLLLGPGLLGIELLFVCKVIIPYYWGKKQ